MLQSSGCHNISDCTMSIVPVIKSDCSVRVCGDYVMINRVAKLDKNPLPRLFASLDGRKTFTEHLNNLAGEAGMHIKRQMCYLRWST